MLNPISWIDACVGRDNAYHTVLHVFKRYILAIYSNILFSKPQGYKLAKVVCILHEACHILMDRLTRWLCNVTSIVLLFIMSRIFLGILFSRIETATCYGHCVSSIILMLKIYSYARFHKRTKINLECNGAAHMSLITMFMGPTRGPPGADRNQVGPVLAPSTLISGMLYVPYFTG